MPRASILTAANPTQRSVAERNQKLRAAIAEKVERIRSMMVNTAPQGFQQHVANLMDARKERISRELASVQVLSLELLLAEIAMHREEGRPETADRLLAALNEGEPLRISTNGAVVIRMSDGQLFLDLG